MKIDFSFVPFPREIWTDSIDLTQAEFRLLGWFCCNLKLGFPQPEISDEQILNGFKNGDAIYPPAGLSRNSLRRAREGLVEKELLTITKKSDGGGRGNEAVWIYRLNLANSDKFMAKPSQVGHKTLPTLTLNPPNLDTHKGEERTERSYKSKYKIFVPPSLEEVTQYCQERRSQIDPEKWFDYYTSNGWRVGRNPMKDWTAAVRTWEKNGSSNGNGNGKVSRAYVDKEAISRISEEVFGPDDGDAEGSVFKLSPE